MPEEPKQPENPEKKETISVDKEDFLELLKNVGELKEAIKILKEKENQPPVSSTALPRQEESSLVGKDYGDESFSCSEQGAFRMGKSPAELLQWHTNIPLFRRELKALMKKYQITEVVARIIKRL